MKYQYQTRPHPDGDCMRACLASILDIPILKVPDFTMIPDKPDFDPKEEYPAWYAALQEFVKGFGFSFVEVQLDKKTWMPLPSETIAIFMGPHESGAKHAIIGRCLDGGFYPLFDPLGSEAAPFTTVEAVCFLVPLDPGVQMKMGRALEAIEKLTAGITSRVIADAIISEVLEGLGRKRFDAPVILDAFGNKALHSIPEINPKRG